MNPSCTHPGEREKGFGREEKRIVKWVLPYNSLHSKEVWRDLEPTTKMEILFPTYNFSVIVFFFFV